MNDYNPLPNFRPKYIDNEVTTFINVVRNWQKPNKYVTQKVDGEGMMEIGPNVSSKERIKFYHYRMYDNYAKNCPDK